MRVPIAEEFFQGHISLERGDGWIRPWRVPWAERELYTQSPWVSWSMIRQAGESTGVRVRFVTAAPAVTLRCEPMDVLRTVDCVIDGRLHATASLCANAAEARFTGLPCTGEKVVELWLPHNAPCAVCGLEVPEGFGAVPAPDTRRRVCIYGSSITHCQDPALSPSRTWPAVVAQRRDMSLTCLGFSGHCHLHTLIAHVMRDVPADLFIMKVGINIYGASSLEGHTFMPNLAGFVRAIRERHPVTPIVVVSPIYAKKFEVADIKNSAGMTLARYRDEVKETVERLTRVCRDDHLTYLDGRDIFSAEDAESHQADGVHPIASGTAILAENMLARLESLRV